METIYKSKIDAGLMTPIFIVVIAVGILMLIIRAWAGIAVVFMLTTLIIHMLLTTQYKIVGKTLKIKSGIFVNKLVNIDSIRSISETNSLLSSPANSTDRLELKYNKFESIIVSPKDKDSFIKNLLELNPRIEVQLKSAR